MWILLSSGATAWVALGLPCLLNSLKSGVTVPSEIHGCKESGSGGVRHSTWSCEFVEVVVGKEGGKKPCKLPTTLPHNTGHVGGSFSHLDCGGHALPYHKKAPGPQPLMVGYFIHTYPCGVRGKCYKWEASIYTAP